MTELVKTSGLQLQLMVRQLKKHFVLVKTQSNCWSTSIRMLYLKPVFASKIMSVRLERLAIRPSY
ncbi:hypothetical protein CMK12_00560 [Candidatus Poribacteria bacterium]|nr:hypothetical protein [Candidatus Poribacteria bacterium]